MRLIGSVANEQQAFTFYSYLQSKQIDGLYETTQINDQFVYQIWVFDEDQFDRAKELLEKFNANPQDPEFQVKQQEQQLDEETEAMLEADKIEEIKKRIETKKRLPKGKSYLTRLIILLCTVLFMITAYNRYQIVSKYDEQKQQELTAIYTPLDQALMYDYPSNQEKAWPGIYNILVNWPKDNSDIDAPLFTKILKGEIWRLITPCILHGGILHLLFNMMWLWLLGRQVEERIGMLRYLVLMIIIGIISNTSQYIMSGFSFLGYSGIICGLAGFIWVRQKLAPWEGYPLQKGTAFFLMIFVLGISLLQVVAFLLQFFHIASFPLYIANTAHVVGALVGMVLARLPVFSR